jgi:elongation of very long chain fatty acids protein 4
MNKILWLFYVSKGLELFDTIFFILRKKFYKISNLHIFNHASMFPIWWLVVAFFANGTSGYVALINSILHVIMQYYYIMSTVGPSYQKWIWWKKYIVQMQMVTT